MGHDVDIKPGIRAGVTDDAIAYERADIAAGQEPCLAELLDGDGDGLLTRDEYEHSRERLAEYDVVDAGFGSFLRFAEISRSAPAKAREAGVDHMVKPRETNATTSDALRTKAYEHARTLIGMAKETDSYVQAQKILGDAGMLLSQLGFVREVKRVHKMIVARARSEGREQDVAYFEALDAMGRNDVASVEARLSDIPQGYAGREVLDEYTSTHRRLERISLTFDASAALANAHIARMEEVEESFLGSTFGVNREEYKDALREVLDAWRERLISGRFESTRMILEDIWENEPDLRRGISILAGFDGADAVDNFDTLDDAISRGQCFESLTLSDLLNAEENPDANQLTDNITLACTNDGAKGKREAAAVAGIYEQHETFRDAMSDLIDREFENRGMFVTLRDSLQGFTQPVNVAIMIGGFGLARITTAALMSRIAPVGVEGLSIAARVGVQGAESVIEAGGFTVYSRMLTSLLTTQPVDWSGQAIAKEWATLALSFGFLRATHAPLTTLRQTLGKTKRFGLPTKAPVRAGGVNMPALTRGGEAIYKVIENLTHTTAFYSGGVVGHRAGFRDVPPHYFEEWLTLLQFQMAVRGANMATKGWVDRKAWEIRSKPALDASRTIAEAIVRGQRGVEDPNALIDMLTQEIYLSHVRGDLSARDLIDGARDVARDADGFQSQVPSPVMEGAGDGRSAVSNEVVSENILHMDGRSREGSRDGASLKDRVKALEGARDARSLDSARITSELVDEIVASRDVDLIRRFYHLLLDIPGSESIPRWRRLFTKLLDARRAVHAEYKGADVDAAVSLRRMEYDLGLFSNAVRTEHNIRVLRSDAVSDANKTNAIYQNEMYTNVWMDPATGLVEPPRPDSNLAFYLDIQNGAVTRVASSSSRIPLRWITGYEGMVLFKGLDKRDDGAYQPKAKAVRTPQAKGDDAGKTSKLPGWEKRPSTVCERASKMEKDGDVEGAVAVYTGRIGELQANVNAVVDSGGIFIEKSMRDLASLESSFAELLERHGRTEEAASHYEQASEAYKHANLKRGEAYIGHAVARKAHDLYRKAAEEAAETGALMRAASCFERAGDNVTTENLGPLGSDWRPERERMLLYGKAARLYMHATSQKDPRYVAVVGKLREVPNLVERMRPDYAAELRVFADEVVARIEAEAPAEPKAIEGPNASREMSREELIKCVGEMDLTTLPGGIYELFQQNKVAGGAMMDVAILFVQGRMQEAEARAAEIIGRIRADELELASKVEAGEEREGYYTGRDVEKSSVITGSTAFGPIDVNVRQAIADKRARGDSGPVRILTIGAGQGMMEAELKAEFGDAITIDTVGLHPVADENRAAFASETIGGIEDVPLSGTYDRILSIYGSYHAPDEKQIEVMQKIVDALDVNGEAFFMTHIFIPQPAKGISDLYSAVRNAFADRGIILSGNADVAKRFIYMRRTRAESFDLAEVAAEGVAVMKAHWYGKDKPDSDVSHVPSIRIGRDDAPKIYTDESKLVADLHADGSEFMRAVEAHLDVRLQEGGVIIYHELRLAFLRNVMHDMIDYGMSFDEAFDVEVRQYHRSGNVSSVKP